MCILFLVTSCGFGSLGFKWHILFVGIRIFWNTLLRITRTTCFCWTPRRTSSDWPRGSTRADEAQRSWRRRRASCRRSKRTLREWSMWETHKSLTIFISFYCYFYLCIFYDNFLKPFYEHFTIVYEMCMKYAKKKKNLPRLT